MSLLSAVARGDRGEVGGVISTFLSSVSAVELNETPSAVLSRGPSILIILPSVNKLECLGLVPVAILKAA